MFPRGFHDVPFGLFTVNLAGQMQETQVNARTRICEHVPHQLPISADAHNRRSLSLVPKTELVSIHCAQFFTRPRLPHTKFIFTCQIASRIHSEGRLYCKQEFYVGEIRSQQTKQALCLLWALPIHETMKTSNEVSNIPLIVICGTWATLLWLPV